MSSPREYCPNELEKLLAGLVRINSENQPSNTEEQLARHVQTVLQGHGIDAELEWAAPGRPNVIARIKGAKPGRTVLFNGHLDTVPAGEGWTVDPLGAAIKNGRLYGRGAADMKAGVAAMMYAAMMLKLEQSSLHGELVLLFNVDEERINVGMKKFIQQKPTADFAVIGEPTELDICVGHKGVSRYRLRTFGTAGHTGFVQDQDNAICKMARLISALEELGSVIRSRLHPVIGNASLTVSLIRGGTAPNIVPSCCEIEIDRRLLPGETQEDAEAEIRQHLAIAAKHNEIDYEIENYTFLPASLIDEQHQLVRCLHQIAEKIRGAAVKVKPFNATCEAPFFSKELGIPTVIYGPGSLQQAHVADEYVELSQLYLGARVYTELARNLLNPGGIQCML